jgi:hypothetical protein
MESNTAYFVPISFIVIILAPGGVFVWLIRRVRHGLLTASSGTGRFLAYSLTPIILYLALSPLSLAVKGAFGWSPVGEAYGRSLFSVVAIGGANALFMSGIFYTVATWYESRRRSHRPDDSTGKGEEPNES